jgi:anti-sigma regulatory factor (Ser/Thr protein kinase)
MSQLGTYWVPNLPEWVMDMTEFPRDEHSVAAARALVAHALGHCDRETVDVARLLTSELATNALVHAHSTFDVAVSESGGVVHVEVTDGSTIHPEPIHTAPLDPHGRGLLLLTEFSEAWGVTDSPSGKTVWFDLRRQEDDSSPSAANARSPRRISQSGQLKP